MLEPIESWKWKLFWSWWIPRAIRKDFYKFEYESSFDIDQSKPLLIVANHFSWWDLFFTVHLNRIFYKKKLYAMGQEEVVRANPLWRTLGVFSVKKGTSEAVKAIRFSVSLLDKTNNAVMICPQGLIESMHVTDVAFHEGGVCSILELIKGSVQVVFQVGFIDYADKRKPTICFYLKEYTSTASSWGSLREGYLNHYTSANILHVKRFQRSASE